MANAGNGTCDTKTIARLLNLTPRRVQQLSDEQVIPKAGRNEYELAPAVRSYVMYLQERVAPKTPSEGEADYHREKALLTRAQRERAELDLAIAREEFLPAADVARVLGLVFSEIKSRLLNQAAARIAARTKSMRDQTKIKAVVREENGQALEALSQIDLAKMIGDGLDPGE